MAKRIAAGVFAPCFMLAALSNASAQEVVPGRIPPGVPPEVTGQQKEKEEEEDGREVLTIEKMASTLVLSTSNGAQSARTAPAWVLTITREEIEQRGYEELTDLLDDLPGMDVIRPHGDVYFRSYWRGYRNLIGAPYLLLLDGLMFNHLYLNEAEIMASFPISAVERVEVVYGPASALYGANAAMGVINVITRNAPSQETGITASSRFFLRTPTRTDFSFEDATKVAEAFAKYQGKGFRASVAARFDVVVLDRSLTDRFEYLSDRYSENERLYGEFLDRPEIAGSFRSLNQKQAVDARVGFGGLEVGFQYNRMRAGTGLVYPGDRTSTRIPYVTFEQSLFLRYRHEFSDTFSSTTLLRFRESHIDPPTAWLEFDHTRQRVTFQYWQSTNFAYTAAQDFSLSVLRGFLQGDGELVLDFGLRYERRDLEQDYIRNGTDSFWDPSQPFSPSFPGGPTYTFPEPTDSERQIANRDLVDALGAYLIARLKIVEGHYLTLGGRLDYNSFFGDVSPILRGGYVGQLLPEFTVKLLYGQAIREPNRRLLFGGFSASGSNLELERERSQTVELGLAYELEFLLLQTDLWLVNVSNGLLSVTGDPQNVGEILTIGLDVSAVALFELPPLHQLKLWLYYSPYLLTEEEVIGADGSSSRQPIGDLANHKVFFGLTADINRNFSATALGRCIGERETVPTNPIRSVDGYCSIDANVQVKNIAFDGLWASVRVTNLLDTDYAHPGIGAADSGTEPGRWVGERWVGSQGFFNSILPQPGRSVALHFGLDL